MNKTTLRKALGYTLLIVAWGYAFVTMPSAAIIFFTTGVVGTLLIED